MRALEKALWAVAYIVVSGIGALLQAVPVMLAAGILHGYWPTIPAFTFWQCVALVWAWSIVWVAMGRNLDVKGSS